MMYYSDIKEVDVANGPGVRVSLFVSGCPHRCKGCFNPEAWDVSYGNQFHHTDRIIELLKKDEISGLSVLGGEPMAPYNVYDVAELVMEVKKEIPDKTIWVYTGYTIEDLMTRFGLCFRTYNVTECYGTAKILKQADVLVDGPFIEEKKDLKLRFRGSSNQRIIDLKQSELFIPETVDKSAMINKLVLAEEYVE